MKEDIRNSVPAYAKTPNTPASHHILPPREDLLPPQSSLVPNLRPRIELQGTIAVQPHRRKKTLEHADAAEHRFRPCHASDCSAEKKSRLRTIRKPDFPAKTAPFV
jgi:hypothetical protein